MLGSIVCHWIAAEARRALPGGKPSAWRRLSSGPGWGRATGAGRGVAGMVGLVLPLLLGLATPARAQFPGELRGQVVAEMGGAVVGGALVELPALGRRVIGDASGAFRLRGLEPGVHQVRVTHPGYAPWLGEVEVGNGRVAWVRVTLAEVVLELEGLAVMARRAPGAGTRLERREIERSGARTAGELVRRVAGVVVREEGTGGAQTVSIRGSGADAVLVLVDGVPLNDPVTGVADLSTIAAGSIESVTVLVGAQGARYGPRAEAGVIVIETRAPEAGWEGRGVVGSLGEWGGSGEGGSVLGGVAWRVGVGARGSDGGFDFPRVPGVDERIERRVNADLAERSAFAVARGRVLGGEVQGRLGGESLRRGIPGKGYAPSPEARQELGRLRGSVGWRRHAGGLSSVVTITGNSQRVRYADPAPPFGFPYDDTVRARALELRAEVERVAGEGWLRRHGGGVEVVRQQVAAGSLGEGVPRHRTDAGAFTHAAVGTALGGWDAELALELRADRDALRGRWYLNRAAALQLVAHGLALHLSNRSGNSPPTLGDQFFREGVAVAPNPDLEAERVPSEWEVGALLAGRAGGVTGSLGARLFQGDIRGMIVWLPDFRFVWSPRNTDVKRRGLEARGELAPGRGVRMAASYTLAVVTYDRPDDPEPVQVAYRPRHNAQFEAGWEGGGWRAGVDALYTGTRYPAPARLNALDPFWTFRLNLGHERRLGGYDLATTIQVDRLFDEKDTLIFGFPEAGRRLRLEARLRRAGSH